MKFRHLLLLVSVLFLSLCGTETKAADIEIGTSSTHSSYNLNLPFVASYKSSTVEFVFTPSEMGGKAATLSSLAFYCSYGYYVMDEVKIYLSHTSSSSLPYKGIPLNQMSLVYSKKDVTVDDGDSGQWNTFAFDNYFHYNGTSNLVVAVTMKSSVVNNNLRFAADTQADNNFIYSFATNDNCFDNIGNMATYSAKSQPRAKFATVVSPITVGQIKYNINSNNKVSIVGTTTKTVSSSLTIPESITYNGNSYSVVAVEDQAFINCTTLTSVTIPSGVQSIGEEAFKGCSKLSSITIKGSISDAGPDAFYGIASKGKLYVEDEYLYENYLLGLISTSWDKYLVGSPKADDVVVTATFNVTSTTEPVRLLTNSEKFKAIYIDGQYKLSNWATTVNTTFKDSNYNNNSFVGQYYTFSTPGEHEVQLVLDETKEGYYKPCDRMYSYAFAGCEALTKIVLPELAILDTRTFEGCTNLSDIVWPTNSLKSIQYGNFIGCSSLKTTTIPTSIETFKGGLEFSGIESFEWPADYDKIPSDFFYACKNLTSVNIPEGVIEIESSAFGECDLTSLTLPSTLTKIGSRAFILNQNLTSVTFNGNSLKSIGRGAFYYCDKLQSITLPESLETIGSYAFESCHALESLIIPASVNTIELKTLSCCWGLSSIVVDANNTTYYSKGSDGVEHNGIFKKGTNELVAGCKTTTFPSNTTSVGDKAFSEVKGLTSVHLPNTVTSIGDSAFYKSSVTIINLPILMETVEPSAFEGCADLTDVYVAAADPISIDATVFKNINSSATLHVPNTAAISKYQEATGWKVFANIVSESNELELKDGVEYTNMEATLYDKVTFSRTYTNTNWRSIILPISLDYDDWKDDFYVAKIYNILAEGDLLNGELSGFTVQALLMSEGTRTTPNAPYLICAKVPNANNAQIISKDNCIAYPAEPITVECSSVDFAFQFEGTYTGIKAPYMQGVYALTTSGSWARGSEKASLKAMSATLKIVEKTGGYNTSFGTLPSHASLRMNVYNSEGEIFGEANAIEYITSDASENESHHIPAHSIGLKPGNYIINGTKIIVE